MSNLIKGHQGDVLFKQVESIPTGAKKVENRPIAYGEHSGHQHVLTGDVEMFEFEGRLIAAVGGDGARLQHIHESKMTTEAWANTVEIDKADHGSHLLPPGNYEFYIQNQFNPLAGAMEQVVD